MDMECLPAEADVLPSMEAGVLKSGDGSKQDLVVCSDTQETVIHEVNSSKSDGLTVPTVADGDMCSLGSYSVKSGEGDVCNDSAITVTSTVENFKGTDVLLNKTVLGDGSDSGVEVTGCFCGSLQRAFSSNSGGYASSCGGHEDSVTSNTTPAVSCDSSLISCYSTYEDTEELGTSTTIVLLHGGDGTSEGGSESSSVTDKDFERQNRSGSNKRSTTNSTSKKKVDVVKSTVDSPRSPAVLSRTNTTRHQAPDTGRRREKVTTSVSGTTRSHISKQSQSGQTFKPSARLTTTSSSSARIRPKTVDTVSHAVVKKDSPSPNTKKVGSGRANSSVRNKPANSPTSDDGQWARVLGARSRGGSLVDSQSKKPSHSSSSSIGTNGTIIESKASALDKYATLPRRRKHKSPENHISENHQRSHSVTRDPSLNRAASLRKQHHQKDKNMDKCLPPYPRRKVQTRTRIFHEVCVQTALVGEDVVNALAGIGIKEYNPVGAVEMQDEEVQVDEHHEDLTQLQSQLKILHLNHSQLQADCERQKQELDSLETEKEILKQQLASTNKRVLAMLGNKDGQTEGVDSLQELEIQLQSSGQTLIQQQCEISDLNAKCRTLQRDLDKSLAAQKTLLQQQQEIEAESMELEEFLQAENLTWAESLWECEAEIGSLKQQLLQKEADVQRQQEECKHLVRISEQRRQENLALEARLAGLEKRSKALLLQQGAAVSGAAVALSGLSSRLDGLVEQLVTSYNISEKDLEVVGARDSGRNLADVIFHNEAYSRSNSSVEGSPEKTSNYQPQNEIQRASSPKRGASFVSAVISAIRNATAQSPFTGSTGKEPEPVVPVISSQVPSPEASELLDCEQEPCLSDDYTEDSSKSRLANSESLQNLSQAILVRQESEKAQQDACMSDGGAYKSEDMSPILEDYCSAATLVDQIIEVDNLVTKLLKVLRILQLENETCIGELNDERTQLAEQVKRDQENKKEADDALWNWERLGAQLRSEVEDARLQLRLKIEELEGTKSDLQHYREQVQYLSQDVCRLNSLCQQFRSREEEAENAVKEWQQTGHLPPAESLANIFAVQNEIPTLKERLAEKEKQLTELTQKSLVNKQLLTDNWHQAIREVRRQYEAIDQALETLQSIQGIVMQCPPLAKLQRELEETNFQSVSTLPVVGADLNANAALVTTNGTHNNESNGMNPLNSITGSV